MKTFLLLASLFSTLSYAISELDYKTHYDRDVLPYFETMTEGDFTNQEGLRIHYYFLTKLENKQTLVIVSGRTETAEKYAEVLYDLRNKGFDLFIMDHQGQGQSERLLKDTNKGHVKKFQNYVDDLTQFIETIVSVHSPKPLSMLAHSMGGAIAVRYLSSHPDLVKKAVLISPMLHIDTKPYSEPVALLYSELLVGIGKGTDYAPDQGPYLPENHTLEKSFTHSEARFQMEKDIYVSRPDLAVEGPTARWVNTALKATLRIDKLPMKTPVLMFQADDDVLVKRPRQDSFCKPSFCQKVFVLGSRHEILMEVDEIRNEALEKIISFLKE